MFNARSVRNNADCIHKLIIDSKSSIVVIIERWLTNNDSYVPTQLTLTNFEQTITIPWMRFSYYLFF